MIKTHEKIIKERKKEKKMETILMVYPQNKPSLEQ